MPHPRPTLTVAEVVRLCSAAFEPSPTELFGLEREWPLWGGTAVDGRPSGEVMARVEAMSLPAGGSVTFEPGGQVELSTRPYPGIGEVLAASRVDDEAIRDVLRGEGYVRRMSAVDVIRGPRRVLGRPRYRAMEAFFDAGGTAGRWMMCNTASTQVNVSHAADDPFGRWHLLADLTPVLVASFANSPGTDGAGRSWASLRQGIWASIDHARTRPVDRSCSSPVDAWAAYALASDVMLIGAADDDGRPTPVAPGLSLGRWISSGHPCGWPTPDDVRDHLTTLFPPVRPRGWLEVRVIDALPRWLAEVCALVVAAACSREAARDLRRVLPSTQGLEVEAARHGLTHPALAHAAQRLLDVVADHLGAVTSDAAHAAVLSDFADRYVRLGRCPADDHPRVRIPVALAADRDSVGTSLDVGDHQPPSRSGPSV